MPEPTTAPYDAGDAPASRSFAVWLDRTERAQLAARAAQAEQERDQARAKLAAAQEALAVVRDAVERIDRALAVCDTTDGQTASGEMWCVCGAPDSGPCRRCIPDTTADPGSPAVRPQEPSTELVDHVAHVVTVADAMQAALESEDPDLARQMWRGCYEVMAEAALAADPRPAERAEG